jgi:hypothetical protein
MTNDGFKDFIAYVGGRDMHDGYIRKVDVDGEKARVTIEGASGNYFVIEFQGVAWIKAHRPEDMMLYALAEWRGDGSVRRFVFSNWEEEDDAFLEIGAKDFQVVPTTL